MVAGHWGQVHKSRDKSFLNEKRKCEFSVIFHLKKNERNTDIEDKLYERQIKN